MGEPIVLTYAFFIHKLLLAFVTWLASRVSYQVITLRTPKLSEPRQTNNISSHLSTRFSTRASIHYSLQNTCRTRDCLKYQKIVEAGLNEGLNDQIIRNAQLYNTFFAVEAPRGRPKRGHQCIMHCKTYAEHMIAWKYQKFVEAGLHEGLDDQIIRNALLYNTYSAMDARGDLRLYSTKRWVPITSRGPMAMGPLGLGKRVP